MPFTDSKMAKVHKMLRRYNSLIVLPYSMKQIPFTVPQHTTPPSLRHDRSDDNFSSEPSSPSSKRPSVEIPGRQHFLFLFTYFYLFTYLFMFLQGYTIYVLFWRHTFSFGTHHLCFLISKNKNVITSCHIYSYKKGNLLHIRHF